LSFFFSTYMADCGTMDFEDMHRTLRRVINDNARIPLVSSVEGDGTDKLVVPFSFQVRDAVAVYDLSNDPSRATNLYAGVFSGNILDLVVVAPLGDIMEFHVKVAPPRIILANSDPDISGDLDRHAPIIVVRIERSVNIDTNRIVKHKTSVRNFGTYFGYSESAPDTAIWETVVHCVGSDEIQALLMANSVYNAIKAHSKRPETYTVMYYQPYEILTMNIPFTNLTDSSEKVSVKSVDFNTRSLMWSGIIDTDPLFRSHELVCI